MTTSKLPLPGLLALSLAAFITVLTEALPAGLLPRMAASLDVSEALVGQLVTAYALGTLLTAIPLTAATRGLRRRPVLLVAIGGFAVVNTVTALSADYALTLAARFLAGVFAGLLWSLAAGYAARIVAPPLQGRAIAVTMAGIPVALSLGIPAGTFLGALVGWRAAFGIMSGLTLLLVGWVLAAVPDFPGEGAGRRPGLLRVLLLPGIRSVLFVTLAYVLAQNILYTYIAPFMALRGLGDRIDLVLLVFGIAALAGIFLTGALIDRHLRLLVLASTVLFGLAAVMLGLGGAVVILGAVGLWGLAYGGVPTLFQTASAKTAGPAADAAQSMIVTVWNIAIAGGGLAGGLVLDRLGAAALPWVAGAVLLPALLSAWAAKRHGFPGA